ncbi:hypothetical protein M9434_003411 [Picochlorum sp. BPE23]|nr:hypothetical protein M9434_003411 [Picochlorum sp. BPE23]
MKIPDEIKLLAKESAPAQRLVSLLASAPEEQLFQDIVQCIVDIVRESPRSKAMDHGSNGVAGGISGEGKDGSRYDFSQTGSFVEQLTFLHPRGKQRLGFLTDRLVVQTSKHDIVILSSDVTDVVILDSIPKDTKNRVWILLQFKDDANIMNGKTRMKACVIQVHATQEIEMKHPKDSSRTLSGNAAVVLCQAIGCCGISPQIFHGSAPEVFQSCNAASAVEAFVRARQGHLFPLKSGLCFLESPAIFIHTNKIRSVDFARAGGASSTFDFQVHLKDGAIEEFSNISRHELNSMQDWVNKTGLSVGFPSDSEEEPSQHVASGDDGSDDDDDEDFDPYKKSSKKLKTTGEDSGDEDGGDASSSSSEDDEGDVELVSEEGFTIEQLHGMMETEKKE